MANRISGKLADEVALTRHVGGQGAFADPFAMTLDQWLFDLLPDASHPDTAASFGAVVSQLPLDELLASTEESEAPLAGSTVSFEDGKPTVRAVSENPEDGTTRTLVARLDESGSLLETEETLERSDGSSTQTLRKPMGENADQTLVTRKNAQGEVVETSTTTRETEADGSRRVQISRTWADGSAHHEEARQTADGTIVDSRITEVATDGSSRTEETTVSEDGSRRTVTTELDADGNVLRSNETQTSEDGIQVVTETLHHPVGRRTIRTEVDANGNSGEAQITDTLRIPLNEGLLDAAVTYLANGNARARITREDHEGHLLEDFEVDIDTPYSWVYGKVVHAEIDLADGTWL